MEMYRKQSLITTGLLEMWYKDLVNLWDDYLNNHATCSE